VEKEQLNALWIKEVWECWAGINQQHAGTLPLKYSLSGIPYS